MLFATHLLVHYLTKNNYIKRELIRHNWSHLNAKNS